MKAVPFFGLCILALSHSAFAFAFEDLTISAKQIQTLGIRTAALPSKRTGEISGLPAQVVVPSNQMFVISTPLPAMIDQILVGTGDSVKKGQALARLQSPALAEAQRGLLQASTQAQLARDNLARDERLWQDGIISETRYRTSKSLALETQAALSERKQMLRFSGMSDSAIAQLQNGHDLNSVLTITSPIDGVILEKTASAGQRLDAAVPLFKVAKLHPLGLEIQAPLSFTPELKVGAVVSIPKFSASGKLTAIGRNLSGGNQTILLRAQITQGTDNLRPGQFVEASVAAAGDHAQWELPNSALVRVDGKVLIFVETSKGFRPEAVTVATEGTQSSTVSGHFKESDKIAVQSASALKSMMMSIGGGE